VKSFLLSFQEHATSFSVYCDEPAQYRFVPFFVALVPDLSI
jgi:hypothetical protein